MYISYINCHNDMYSLQFSIVFDAEQSVIMDIC